MKAKPSLSIRKHVRESGMSEQDLNRRLATLGSLYALAKSLRQARPAVGLVRESRALYQRAKRVGKEK